MNINNSLSSALVLGNIGLAAFSVAAPANSLPWWVIAGIAALNAIVHALPSTGLNPVAPATK